MKERLRRSWFNLPVSVRKPVVLTVGLIFVLAAGLIGWLPGPGGIPLFLIGVAILATEYEWAERLKQFILKLVHQSGHWARTHRREAWALSVGMTVTIAIVVFYWFSR